MTARSRLLALITSAQARLTQSTPDSAAGVSDDADRAALYERREQSFGERARLREQIVEAQKALERLDDGSYGSCVDCDHPIAPKRLEARPTAARCLGCQAKSERVMLASCSA